MSSTISTSTDITSLVSQLISLERSSGPVALYEEQKTELTRKNATLTDLQTNLTALQTQATALSQPGSLSSFQTKQVTSSQSLVATATATSSAVSGSHTLRVSQVAKRSAVVSDRLAQDGTDLLAAAGAGERRFQISLNGETTSVTVTLEAGDTNQEILQKMASAVNDSEAALTASVVSDTDSTTRLVLTSDETGSANAITLADESGGLLAAAGAESGVAAADASGGYLYASSELDAVFTLDGLTMTRSGNTVSDAIPGVTLSLLSAQEATDKSLTLTVGPDNAAIQKKLQSFLDAYNTVVKFLNARTSTSVTSTTGSDGTTDVTDVTRGTLAGESSYQTLLLDLRRLAGGQIATGIADGPASLSEIGITAAKDGTLSITDTSKLEAALTESADAVAALFNSDEGLCTQINDRLSTFVNTGGILDSSMATVSSKISALNAAIDMGEKALDAREAALLTQYTALQQTLIQLDSQQSMIEQLLAQIEDATS